MSIAKRILNHETWINDDNERDHSFNPAPKSEGWDLFEHWEVDAGGEPCLLLITSSPNDVGSLAPGSFILG
ncbi:hypothetical protein [Gordonia sp. NPDC003376]